MSESSKYVRSRPPSGKASVWNARRWLAENAIMDVFDRNDGIIGGGWTCSPTWSIASGIASNTPGAGTELLVNDPDFEAGFTAGLANVLTKSGSPTLAQSADAQHGSHAQSFLSTLGYQADNLRFTTTFNTVARSWYLMSVWAKRTTNTGVYPGSAAMGLYDIAGGGDERYATIGSATWAQMFLSMRSVATSALFIYPVKELSGYEDTVIVDNCSCKILTTADLFMLRTGKDGNQTIATGWTDTQWTDIGCVARANSLTSPSTYLLARLCHEQYVWYAMLEKVVAGTPTVLIARTALDSDDAFEQGRLLEIRCSGSSVSLWYNDQQIGATQTVTDVPVAQNIYGAFSTGQAVLNRIYLGPTPAALGFAWLGSSITAAAGSFAHGDDHGTSYRLLTQAYIKANYPQFSIAIPAAGGIPVRGGTYPFLNSASSGTNSWNNLARLDRVIAYAPSLMVRDFMNDSDIDLDHAAAEALIRRLYAALPNLRQAVFIMRGIAANPGTDARDTNLTLTAYEKALFDHYNIPYIDWGAYCASLVAAGHNVSEYWNDTIHPNDAGHLIAFNMLQPLIDGLIVGRDGQTVLAPRIYPLSAYMEGTPTIKTGNQCDSKSGSWGAYNTTGWQSSTPGDTITFSFYGISIGAVDANNVSVTNPIEYSIDGGAYQRNPLLYADGGLIGQEPAPHTITIRLRSDTPMPFQLAYFLAI